MAKIKLLIIEDEEGICDFVKYFFEKRGLEVFYALNGKEGLEIFEREKPQVIILDIIMKGMDGIEVLRRLKQIDKNNDVFMITKVDDEPEKVKQAKSLGAVDYITKPLELENLEEVIMKRIEKQKAKE